MTARTARPPFRVCLLTVTLLTVDDRHSPGNWRTRPPAMGASPTARSVRPQRNRTRNLTSGPGTPRPGTPGGHSTVRTGGPCGQHPKA